MNRTNTSPRFLGSSLVLPNPEKHVQMKIDANFSKLRGSERCLYQSR
jgi:hypothetical protein